MGAAKSNASPEKGAHPTPSHSTPRATLRSIFKCANNGGSDLRREVQNDLTTDARQIAHKAH